MSPAEALTTSGTGVSAGDALARAVTTLRDAGSPSARLDAEVLVAWTLERDRAWLLAHLDEAVAPGRVAVLDGWIRRRAAGEPVAYIRGFKEWHGFRVATDPRALIPRPETELLVDSAVAEIAARLVRDDQPLLAWDVGTGSGAVAVALARRFRSALALGRLRLVASDLSAEALELATENLAVHGAAGLVTVMLADLLDPVGSQRLPDVVVANLPYVRSAEVATGVGSLVWEPRAALDGGDDGLDHIRALLAQLPARLAPDGSVLLEVGAEQAAAVRMEIAALPGRWSVTAEPDLAGHERIVRMERQP